MNGYGLTEGGTSVVTMPPGEALQPSRFGGPAGGARCGPGGRRQRCRAAGGDHRGGGHQGRSRSALLPQRPRGHRRHLAGDWVQSGDLGYFDEDGFLYLVDRKKDVIVRGGYNVSSIEVESALHEHPDVIEAAVLGVPHPVLGQDVAAVVRLRPGASLDVAAARAFLADRVADYKRPRRIVAQDGPLPRTAMGKLDKAALRRILEADGRTDNPPRRS